MTIFSRIRVVIFDLGGVILRTDNPLPRVQLAERLGLTRPELENIVFNNPVSQAAERGLASPADVWAAVAKNLNLPAEEMPAIRAQFFGGDQVDFRLIEMIQNLRPAYKTMLLSNTWVVDLETALRETFQILDTFDVVISSAHRQVTKPDPAIFKLALQMVNACAEEAVFVDDSAKNIQAAAALGIRTIHFRNADQARAELMTILDENG